MVSESAKCRSSHRARGLGILAALAGTTQAATYYVAPPPVGNDAQNGSQATPWATPHKARDVAQAGDTVYFRQGEYRISKFIFFNRNAGTPEAPIVYASYPGERATIIDERTALSDPTEAPIFFVARPHHTLKNLRILQTPASFNSTHKHTGVAVYASNTTVQGCEIVASGQGIFSAKSTRNGIYRENYIHHTGSVENLDHGLYLCGDNEQVINNIVTHCKAHGIQVAGYTTVTSMKIYNNVFAFNGRSGAILWRALDGVDIKNNIFYKNRYTGIASYAAHGSGVIFDRNMFFGNPTGTIQTSNGATNGTASDYTFHMGTNFTTDPQFLSETSDYHVKAGSQAIDNGARVQGVEIDFSRARRPQGNGFDIGPYEKPAVTAKSPLAPRGLTVR